MRLTLGYVAVCWDPYRGQVSALNRVQKRAAKFANSISSIKIRQPECASFSGNTQGYGLGKR